MAKKDQATAEDIGFNAVSFGRMMGLMEATHDNVKEMKEDSKEQEDILADHRDRIVGLENRNKNIKDNWKKAGWFTTCGAGVWGFCKMIGGYLT